MARARTIKASFFTNDELGALNPRVRLLFAGLWPHADRAGRLLDRPTKLKVEICPYDHLDVDKALDQLAEHGFIIRYQAAGQACIQVVNWAKHQRPHQNEPATELPPPPGWTDGRPAVEPEVRNGRSDFGVEVENGASTCTLARARPGTRNPVSGLRSPVSGLGTRSPVPEPGTRNSEPGDARAAREGSESPPPKSKRSAKAPPAGSEVPFNDDLAQRMQAISLEFGDDNAVASITRAQRYQAAAALSAGQMATAIKDAHRRTERRLGDQDAKPLGSPMAYFLGVLEQTTQERMKSA
jgi:hypothetical protein